MTVELEEKIDAYFQQFPSLTVSYGEILISSTDAVSSVYYLKKGLIRQYLVKPTGEEITINIFRASAIFPLMLVLPSIENSYHFASIDETFLYKAPADEAIAFLKENPDVLYEVALRFANAINGFAKKIETILFADAHAKVAYILMYLASRYGNQTEEGVVIQLPVTHSDIETLIGLPRETISRHFTDMKEQGIVDYRGKLILIKDQARLKQEISKETRER